MLRLSTIAIGTILASGCGDDEAPFDVETCDAPVLYRIGRVDLPDTTLEARAAAFDLDGDSYGDNQLGAVSGAFHEVWRHPFEERANAHLTTDVDWRVALRRCPEERLAVALHRADGDPAYLVTEPGGSRARGPGGVELPLGSLFDGLGTNTEAGWLVAELATIEISDPAAAELALDFGVALEATTGTTIVVEAMTPYLDATLEPFYRTELDADGDGTITVVEVRESEFMRSLLAPDLDLDRDDEREELSLALPLVATPL